MRKYVLFIISIFVLTAVSYSFSSKEEFKNANDLFNAGKYSKAVDMYNNLLDSGYKESEVYYNLGNSYFRLDKIPLAILNYERAIRLNPNDDDIDFNLKLANLKIVDKFEPLPRLFFIQWYEQLLKIMYSGVWGIVMVVSVWIYFATAMILLFANLTEFRKLVVLISILSFLMFFISGIIGYKTYTFENSKNQAIIFTPNVYVKSAPDPGSTDLFILHEGTKVYLMENIDNWIQIRLQNGNVGWIKNNEVEII